LLNGSYGYRWSGNNGQIHLLNPVELNIITLTDTTAEFSQYFDTLYLRHSYESQFIQAASYSFQYSSQDLKRRKDFHFFKWNAEMAGNILHLLSNLAGRQRNDAGYYEIFSTPFAQYVKSDFEYRFYHYRGQRSLFVYRAFFGLGIPYGNAEVLPFVKKYYSGGPNSIRAWTVRSLGPGSFIDDSSFPDLASDMKLEMNLEYRFDVFWKLKGAIFLDAGNIWAINRFDERSGALFRTNRFIGEMAIGTGLGARFDFDFILLRVDMGLKVRDPEKSPNSRWVLSNWKNGDALVAWNIGIGYPF
jgi:outer membrane protein assembly factor BamA